MCTCSWYVFRLVMTTAQTDEATKHVPSHHLESFAYIAVPKVTKMNNGSGFQQFCAQWKIGHTTSIPHNPQGHRILEHTHSSLKMQLQKIEREAMFPVSTWCAKSCTPYFKFWLWMPVSNLPQTDSGLLELERLLHRTIGMIHASGNGGDPILSESHRKRMKLDGCQNVWWDAWSRAKLDLNPQEPAQASFSETRWAGVPDTLCHWT